MKRKALSLLLALSMSASLLACGNKSAGKEEKTTSGAEKTGENKASAGGSGDFAGQKLTVLYMSGVYADAAKSMVKEFEDKTGATVDVIDMPYTELHQKMLLDFTSGAGTYDVVDVASQWDEYREELKKVTKKDEGFYGASISGITGQLGGVFDYVLWSMGGAWATEDWKVSIDSPETRKALEHLNSLQESLDPNWLNWGTDQSIQAFLNGDAAVCETWPTLGLVQDADNPDKSKVVGKWALSVIPKEKTGITLLSAWDCAIPEGSKNKELAWEWIKMYTSLEKQDSFYKDYGILSPRKAFWEEDGIKGTYMDTVREALDTANMWWRVAASTQVDTSFNTLISAYLSGQTDLETTVKEMKAAVEEALQQAPPEEGTKNYNH